MRFLILVLVASIYAVDAMPFQHQAMFALPPPPANMNMQFVRPTNLMPGAGMRMLSGTYKTPASTTYSAPTPAPAPAPAYHYAAPVAYAPAPYYPHQPQAPMNIINNNGNDNFNHNSDEHQARSYDDNKYASTQGQDLNDILAAYSLQNFLHNSRPSTPSYSSNLYREQPKLKEKYVSSTQYATGHTGSYNAGSSVHHNSGSNGHYTGSHYDRKDTKSKYLNKPTIPKQTHVDYTSKPDTGKAYGSTPY